MKNKIILFFAGCISLMLISCLDSDDNYDTVVVKDAQIKTLTLSHDSISGLSDVVFTIDQINGQIFNRDSLPYGTEVEKVLCTLTYVTGVLGTQVTQEAYPDSTYYWNGSDSLDFSKPVKFVTTAYDGSTQKTYTAKVNIHTLVPDSMVWELYTDKLPGKNVSEQKVILTQYNGEDVYFMYTNSAEGYQLFYSPISDLNNWTELPLTGFLSDNIVLSQITLFGGFYATSANGELYLSENGIEWGLPTSSLPNVYYILGVLPEGRSSSLMSTIINDVDGLRFASMDDKGVWTVGNIVPDNFPLTGFGSQSYNNMHYEYLMIIAGKDKNDQLTNAAWGTMNATSWTLLTDKHSNYFEKKEGVMLSAYDNKLCLVGGINENGEGSKEIHFSSDYGVTWQLSDTLVVFPEEYSGRGFASVIVDKENYMLIFGGKTSSKEKSLGEIWQGRINRLGFKD